MRLRFGAFGLGLIGLMTLAPAFANAEPIRNSSDPRAIMEEVYRRIAGERRSSRMLMTIKDGTGSRQRGMTLRSAGSKDARKTLIIIDSPADQRGTGFLSVDYAAADKSDERWLYLPALKRTTRLATGQLSNSFLGSDFSFSDLSPIDPSLLDFSIQSASTNVDGQECWLIVATPKAKQTEKILGYTKSEFWVSKDALAFVRIRASLLDGQKVKYIQASNFEKTADGTGAHKVEARTVQNGKVLSQTLLEVLSLTSQDTTISDADFTTQRLERGL